MWKIRIPKLSALPSLSTVLTTESSVKVGKILTAQPITVIEPPHDKTNKIACAPRGDSDQPGHLPSLIRVFAVHLKKAWVLGYPLSTQRRLWSDWADAQADLSLRWAHSHFVSFVMRRLNYQKLLTVVLPLSIVPKVFKRCSWHAKQCRPWSDCSLVSGSTLFTHTCLSENFNHYSNTNLMCGHPFLDIWLLSKGQATDDTLISFFSGSITVTLTLFVAVCFLMLDFWAKAWPQMTHWYVIEFWLLTSTMILCVAIVSWR